MRGPALPQVDRERLGLPAVTPADPIAGWRTARARAQTWLWQHRAGLALGVPMIALVAVVRLWGLSHGPPLADDEGTYVAQAWAIQVRHALAPYTYWYDHPPLGWIQLAGFTWLTGTFSGHGLAVLAVRRLMVGYAAADGALIWLLARRLGVRRGWAAFAVLLWALSPLAVGYSRMVYLDNIALPWSLGAFVLAAGSRRSLWAFIGSGVTFAIAILTKETMLLLLPALALLVWQRTSRRTRSFCVVGFATAFVLVAAAYPLLAVLKGELLPGPGHVSMVQALQFQFLTRPSTGSALASGTASRTIVDHWLAADHWLPVAGLVGMVPCLLTRRLRPVGVALALLVAAALRPGYLPDPFVIAMLPFAAVAAAAGLDLLWSATGVRARVRRPSRFAIALAALGAATAVVPAWVSGDAALASTEPNRPVLAAERWLEANASHVPGDILVDDTMWADLVTHGLPADRVVWFYKLDYVNNLDPSVRRRISTYHDLGLLVSTPIIRAGLAQSTSRTYPLARQAFANSVLVASFGSGAERIEIRQVTGTPTKGPTPRDGRS
jgi:4-amino-4-deoxy-L-arabinose transferase-like glycosyltransferase